MVALWRGVVFLTCRSPEQIRSVGAALQQLLPSQRVYAIDFRGEQSGHLGTTVWREAAFLNAALVAVRRAESEVACVAVGEWHQQR